MIELNIIYFYCYNHCQEIWQLFHLWMIQRQSQPLTLTPPRQTHPRLYHLDILPVLQLSRRLTMKQEYCWPIRGTQLIRAIVRGRQKEVDVNGRTKSLVDDVDELRRHRGHRQEDGHVDNTARKLQLTTNKTVKLAAANRAVETWIFFKLFRDISDRTFLSIVFSGLLRFLFSITGDLNDRNSFIQPHIYSSRLIVLVVFYLHSCF